MSKQSNISELMDAGHEDEAVALLVQGIRLVAAVGPRSAKAALEVAQRLYGGDLVQTIYFMNRSHPWLGEQTPIERAERSDEDLEVVLNMCGQIEAGVYI